MLCSAILVVMRKKFLWKAGQYPAVARLLVEASSDLGSSNEISTKGLWKVPKDARTVQRIKIESSLLRNKRNIPSLKL
jgi:hypothetical protein